MEIEDYCNQQQMELDLFQKKVVDEGHAWIKNVLDNNWFDGIRTGGEKVWSGIEEQYDCRFFPYRWLQEEGEWDFINQWFPFFSDKTQKKQILRTKLKRIISNNWMEGLTTALEIKAGCSFIRDGVFVEIDYKVSGKSKQNVDFLIKIDQRDVLVEATATTVGLVNPAVKVGSLSIPRMENQIRKKIVEKSEFQLQEADKPVVLIISLPPFLGADHFTAKWAIDECLPQYSQISAILVSDSYLFKCGAWYFNPQAKFPLNNNEKKYISTLLLLNGKVKENPKIFNITL